MDLPGPKQDDKPARQFICDMYLAQNPDPDRMCYSHFTVATGQTWEYLVLESTYYFRVFIHTIWVGHRMPWDRFHKLSAIKTRSFLK